MNADGVPAIAPRMGFAPGESMASASFIAGRDARSMFRVRSVPLGRRARAAARPAGDVLDDRAACWPAPRRALIPVPYSVALGEALRSWYGGGDVHLVGGRGRSRGAPRGTSARWTWWQVVPLLVPLGTAPRLSPAGYALPLRSLERGPAFRMVVGRPCVTHWEASRPPPEG